MNDEQLRMLVRDAVARHLAARPELAAAPAAPWPAATAAHPGFQRYPLSRGEDDDGACLIEPRVRCNHCGFCQSHGF